jgi:hypothetical protein
MILVAELKKPAFTKSITKDLLHIKRTKVNSGSYPKVSFFEAANRICSDLTLLHGCANLFKKRKDIHYFKCCLGTKHGIDLIGCDKSNKVILKAEVFCTSEKFFKAKFYKEKEKRVKVIIFQKLNSTAIQNFIKNQEGFDFIDVDIEAELPLYN